jgi:ATP-dependent Clp protease ATP-binding subunit ClpC
MFERFTDAARRVLVLAQEEARLLNHNFIGTEHILLGLLHEGEGVGARALAALDVNLSDAREKVEAAVAPADGPISGSPPFTPRAKKVLELSLREALQLGHSYIGTEHLLLGLVREGEGVAAQVLVSLGADLSRARQEVIVLLAGHAPEAPTVEPPSGLGRSEPRCGRCRSELAESARFRTIEVPPDETGGEVAALRVTVLYCSRCGTLLSPPGSPGTASMAPGPDVRRAWLRTR